MIEITIALIIFLFPLAYSPGPGKLFFCSQWCTLWFRRDYAFKHRLSYCNLAGDRGDWAWYDRSFERLSECASGVKNVWCRVCLWLAWKLIRAGRYDGQGKAKPATFWDGVILLLLNPKAYIIMALMFSQFLSIDGGLQIANVLAISTIFTLNNFVGFRFGPL
jgi:hypothetical protein